MAGSKFQPQQQQPIEHHSIQYSNDNHRVWGPQDDEKKGLISNTQEKSGFRKELEIAVLMILVIIFGALNRVASKIMTKPMGNYSFFLSLFNGVAYCILYYGILFVRYFTGRVSREDMLFPWTKDGVKYFIISGFMDGLGNVLGIIPAPYLSGPMMSLMSQTIVLFSVICAIVILRTRYTLYQIGAVGIVVAGAIVALIPQFENHGQSQSNPLGWLILYAFSTLPNAISFTIKELVFRKRKGLEVFVVNSSGSLFQLIWWPATIPITVILNQTGGKPLGEYIQDGFACFAGKTPVGDKIDCSPDPYPYLVYIGLNLAFNIFLLILLKRASALQGFMAIKAILPIAVILFLIKWPLIGSSSIDQYTIYSLIIILIGLGLYRYTTVLKERKLKQLENNN